MAALIPREWFPDENIAIRAVGHTVRKLRRATAWKCFRADSQRLQLLEETYMSKPKYSRKKRSFAKDVAKGTAKGLSKLASDTAVGVVGELASILTLGIFRSPRRY